MITEAFLNKVVSSTRKVMELPAQVEVGKVMPNATQPMSAADEAALARATAKLRGRT